MNGYSVEIKEVSKDFSKRERIMLKDTTNAIKIDTILETEEEIVITPVAYAILSIHNEKSDNKDYEHYVILDKNGDKYVTGSPSFWASFSEIWDEISDDDSEEWQVKLYKRDSKNYKGKKFLTCSVI